MGRARIGLACVAVLLALPACDSSQKAPPVSRSTPLPQPAESLCERVRPTLAGDWKTEQEPPSSFPLSDVCSLTNSADPENRFSISVAVLPVSAQDAAEFRKDETRRLKGHYVVQPVDGGVGQGSWAVNPAAAGPWLVFRSGGRLVKVFQNAAGQGHLEAVKALARTIDSLPGGIAPTPAFQRRPECERGTAAAERLLGTKATARRDTLVDGFVSCRWGSSRSAAVATGGGPGSDAAVNFRLLQDAGGSPQASNRRVTVGHEGWQQHDGYLAYRLAESTYVSVVSYPTSSAKSAHIVALARAVRPAYAR